MLLRLRTWQIVLAQLAIAIVLPGLLALFVHFPDLARRPEPAPQRLFLVSFCGAPIVLMLLAAAGVRSPNATSWVSFVSAIFAWVVVWYALMFVWINTFGE